MLTAKELIKKLDLQPLAEEGGYFKRIYESNDMNQEGRRLSASIYYLLEGKDFSCFHRLDCDELWHFYAGDSLLLHIINSQGVLNQLRLGNPLYDPQAVPFTVIERGVWFAGEVTNASGFSLVGCTTTPEFQFATFEAANTRMLSTAFPQHAALITKLTRR